MQHCPGDECRYALLRADYKVEMAMTQKFSFVRTREPLYFSCDVLSLCCSLVRNLPRLSIARFFFVLDPPRHAACHFISSNANKPVSLLSCISVQHAAAISSRAHTPSHVRPCAPLVSLYSSVLAVRLFVQIDWTPDSLKPMRRALVSTHKEQVMSLLGPFQATVQCSDKQDLSTVAADIAAKLGMASVGAASLVPFFFLSCAIFIRRVALRSTHFDFCIVRLIRSLYIIYLLCLLFHPQTGIVNNEAMGAHHTAATALRMHISSHLISFLYLTYLLRIHCLTS
jgi:hypothetical protein